MEDYAPLDEGQEAHWEVVERILFLYAKLNPGTVITRLTVQQVSYISYNNAINNISMLKKYNLLQLPSEKRSYMNTFRRRKGMIKI